MDRNGLSIILQGVRHRFSWHVQRVARLVTSGREITQVESRIEKFVPNPSAAAASCAASVTAALSFHGNSVKLLSMSLEPACLWVRRRGVVLQVDKRHRARRRIINFPYGLLIRVRFLFPPSPHPQLLKKLGAQDPEDKSEAVRRPLVELKLELRSLQSSLSAIAGNEVSASVLRTLEGIRHLLASLAERARELEEEIGDPAQLARCILSDDVAARVRIAACSERVLAKRERQENSSYR